MGVSGGGDMGYTETSSSSSSSSISSSFGDHLVGLDMVVGCKYGG